MTQDEMQSTLKELKSEPWIKLPYKFAYFNTETGEEISGTRIAEIERNMAMLEKINNGTG